MGISVINSKLDVKLPDHDQKEREPTINDICILMQGERKIGKTTFISKFGNPFFFCFDRLQKFSGVLNVYCPTWDHALKYRDLLVERVQKDPTYADKYVIDIGGMAYDKNLDYVCKSQGVEWPSFAEDRGVTWKAVNKSFLAWHESMTAVNLSASFISHAKLDTVTKRGGDQYQRVKLEMSTQATNYYTAICDMSCYYDYDIDGNRILIIQGNDFYTGVGHGVTGYFKTTKGEDVISIPMGSSEDEAYENFIKAFNNEQEVPGDYPRSATGTEPRKTSQFISLMKKDDKGESVKSSGRRRRR
jgi:hypothetical protein